jgi:hypothetical protein
LDDLKKERKRVKKYGYNNHGSYRSRTARNRF